MKGQQDTWMLGGVQGQLRWARLGDNERDMCQAPCSMRLTSAQAGQDCCCAGAGDLLSDKGVSHAESALLAGRDELHLGRGMEREPSFPLQP